MVGVGDGQVGVGCGAPQLGRIILGQVHGFLSLIKPDWGKFLSLAESNGSVLIKPDWSKFKSQSRSTEPD